MCRAWDARHFQIVPWRCLPRVHYDPAFLVCIVSTTCLPTSSDFSCFMYRSPHVNQCDVGLPQTLTYFSTCNPMQPGWKAQELLRNVIFLFHLIHCPDRPVLSPLWQSRLDILLRWDHRAPCSESLPVTETAKFQRPLFRSSFRRHKIGSQRCKRSAYIICRTVFPRIASTRWLFLGRALVQKLPLVTPTCAM